MQSPWKIKFRFFKIQEIIFHSFTFQHTGIIDLFNTFYFVLFGQFFQDAGIKVDPVQPLLRIIEFLRIDIAGTNDLHDAVLKLAESISSPAI